ncbi:hypothetical protein [Secundilactobacillus odoratitofui]|nr:hypothetical protein [Secundilactobacillus odoratitofui]
MAKFELYHPIQTPHYQLDWLTQFKVKDINTLRQQTQPAETIIQTANFVNRVMSTIMHDQALTWGVSFKQSGEFAGIVSLNPIEEGWTNAELNVSPVKTDATDLIAEIEAYMTQFAQNQLGTQHLKLNIHN